MTKRFGSWGGSTDGCGYQPRSCARKIILAFLLDWHGNAVSGQAVPRGWGRTTLVKRFSWIKMSSLPPLRANVLGSVATEALLGGGRLPRRAIRAIGKALFWYSVSMFCRPGSGHSWCLQALDIPQVEDGILTCLPEDNRTSGYFLRENINFNIIS